MAVSAWRQAGVYRRRRILLLAVVSLLVILPWCAASRSGGGAGGGVDRAAVTPLTATDGKPVACRTAAAALPVRQQLALLTMEGIDGDDVDGLEALLGRDERPGGVFVRKGSGVWDDKALVDPPADGLPLLVAVDDEGGRVHPLRGVLEDLPSAADRGGTAAADLEAQAKDRGAQLRAIGINVVFVPVVDVGAGGGIGDRSFSDDPATVTAAAGAWAAGLRAAGVLPVLKHFPGEGHATVDPHAGPTRTPTVEQLRASDLEPYESLLDDEPVGVMVGHLDVPGLTTEGVPASVSPAAIGLLRGAYDFDGLVVTDDLVGMQAIRSRFDVPEAAERALAAGADLLLFSDRVDIGPVLDRLEDAVAAGRVPARRVDAALDRVLAAGGCA